MEENQNNARSYPAKWIQWLVEESRSWTEKGIISEEQRGSIAAIYASRGQERVEEQKNARFVAIVSILGSILIGLGLILFFASNWSAIPVWCKLTLVFGLITITYAAGYWFAYEKKSYPKVGNALIFLGVLFFGAGIWLIAQIFHIKADYPLGQLVWALAGLATAIVTRQKFILALSVILFGIWNTVEQAQNASYNFLFPILLLGVVFPLAWKLHSKLTAVLSILGVLMWLIINMAFDELGFGIILAITMLFFLGLYALASSCEFLLKKGGLDLILKYLFVLGAGISGFILTFRYAGEESGIYSPAGLVYLGIVSAVLALSSIHNIFFKPTRKPADTVESSVLLAIGAVLFIFALELFAPMAFTITFNIIYVLLLLAVVRKGFSERSEYYINVALALFILDVIARYFDYAWKLIDRSVFFMIGGIILLAGGVLLEKWRRKVTGELRVMSHEG